MILKILLVIAVVGLVYFMFIKKKPIKKDVDSTTKKDEKLESTDMIECTTCKIYSEVGDSLLSNGKYYCSAECLENR